MIPCTDIETLSNLWQKKWFTADFVYLGINSTNMLILKLHL